MVFAGRQRSPVLDGDRAHRAGAAQDGAGLYRDGGRGDRAVHQKRATIDGWLHRYKCWYRSGSAFPVPRHA